MGIRGDDAHLGVVARQHGPETGRAALIRAVSEGQEDVIRECRAHDLLEMPRRIADVEIRQRGLLGELRTQVGDYLVIRLAHLRLVEMLERDHGGRSGERRSSNGNWSDPGKEIPVGRLRECRKSQEGKTGEQQRPENGPGFGDDGRHQLPHSTMRLSGVPSRLSMLNFF